MPAMSFTIGVGAGKFLGVGKIFAQISPTLPEETPKKMTSKEKEHICPNFP